MIRQIFLDVYQGKISTREAGGLIHIYCNAQKLNPAIETPITILMTTEAGRDQIQGYESFLMNISWLMAKLSAHAVAIDEALEQFFTSVADLNEKMFKGYSFKKSKQENDPDNYFREMSCPTCGMYGRHFGDYQDFNSVEA